MKPIHPNQHSQEPDPDLFGVWRQEGYGRILQFLDVYLKGDGTKDEPTSDNAS